MSARAADILRALDAGCEAFTFPMLDNGYVYLAATRLSVFRSPDDWALVFEVFGFSPRDGTPSTNIVTFASRLHDRDPPENYATRAAYKAYLASHPHDEFRSVYPFDTSDWQDEDDEESVAESVREVTLRGRTVALPELDAYAGYGIEQVDPERVQVFEACRYLAGVAREDVLATNEERRVSVLPEMELLISLDEWHHPNVVADERPSGSRTFQQLARVLETGDVGEYAPSEAPNTHWGNWPDGGSL